MQRRFFMRIEPIDPIYKSTFNTKQNPNKNNQSKQDKKNKAKENPAVILEISAEGRRKLEEDLER